MQPRDSTQGEEGIINMTNDKELKPVEHEIGFSDLAIMTDEERDAQQDRRGIRTSCGWFSWRPSCLKCFAGPRWLLVTVCAYLFFQSMAVNGLVDGSLASLQRRFELSSLQTGLLPALYDIFAASLCVVFGYAGITGNKPRLLTVGIIFIGLGNLVFALPHFTTGQYAYIASNSSDICSASDEISAGTTPVPTEADTEISSLSGYLYIFVLSKALFAVGGCMGYSVGFAFVDESIPTKNAGIYLGMLSVFATLGPSIGLVLSGVSLSIFTDFDSVTDSVGIESDNIQWVGAWWLCFILCGIVSFVIAIPMSCFPHELPGTQMIREQRESQAHAHSDRAGKASREDFCKSWRDFPSALRMLLRNPTFLTMTVASASDYILIAGVGAFLPIYLENQYGLSAGNANIITGALACVAGGGSLFFGGWLVKRFKLKVLGMLKLIMVVTTINALMFFTALFTCPELPLAGVYQHYANNSAVVDVRLNDACNTGCHCSTTPYAPVCGSNDVMYFSPCFAGCQDQTDGDKVLYYDCTCVIDYDPMTNDSAMATADPGRCGTYCTQMYIFLGCLFVIIATAFMDKVPWNNTVLRCVPDGQQSFALGIYGFTVRLFGSVPGPILFGSIIDSTCTLWHEEDGERGQCWFHDRTDLSLYLIIFGVALKIIALIFVVVAYKMYKPPCTGLDEIEKEIINE